MAELQQSEGHEQTSRPSQRKGRLRVFFGMSPGVGKTCAMLEAARARAREGLDVVAGVVETHGRAETKVLLEDIEALPPARLEYRGAVFDEFDLEGMLKRAPQIALMDELAHSNVPGSRHPKRYQDVRELLDHGIDVYTTINVQHLESRADSVEALTQTRVNERVPDTVLEWADEVQVIDITPGALRQRLTEGKVYRGDKAATAADAFFSERNLAALREMALRSTAERVNRDLLKVLKHERDTAPLPTGERIMVAVGSSPFSEKLIRWTKRYATSLNAGWVAVHVEREEPLDPGAQKRLDANLEFARSLGAEIASSTGEDVVESLLRTARRELVTQIVAGRSPSNGWRRLFVGRSLTNRLVAGSGSIAVHVVPGEENYSTVRWDRLRMPATANAGQYLYALCAALALGLFSYPFRAELGHWTIALLFLALTVFGGFLITRGPVLLLALISAFGWNFFYVPPQFTFTIHSPQDVLFFFILLLVAITMGQLTSRLRALNLAERRRETRAFALYRFLDCLNHQQNHKQTIQEALAHATEVSGREVSLILAGANGDQSPTLPETLQIGEKEWGVIRWVLQNHDMAGAGTQNLPDIASLFLPVESGGQAFAVMRIAVESKPMPLASRDLLLQMARLLGRFLERERLREQLEHAKILEASQRLQKTLLDTVSHELKTPLTIILGALERNLQPDAAAEPELLRYAETSAKRLLRNVNMLLDLTRIEGGIVRPKTEFVDLEDLVRRLKYDLTAEFGGQISDVNFHLYIQSVRSDETLLFQLLNQLLRNALIHTPVGTPVTCEVDSLADKIRFVVSDEGPGLGADIETLFEPFSHGSRQRSKGLGLGLSIARRIVETLGGKLNAENRDDGGAKFTAILPDCEANSGGLS